MLVKLYTNITSSIVFLLIFTYKQLTSRLQVCCIYNMLRPQLSPQAIYGYKIYKSHCHTHEGEHWPCFQHFWVLTCGLLARRQTGLLFERLFTVIYGLVLVSSSWDIRQSYFVVDNLRWGKHTAFIFSCHLGHFFSSIVFSFGISFPCNQFKLKTLMTFPKCYTAFSPTLRVFLQRN